MGGTSRGDDGPRGPRSEAPPRQDGLSGAASRETSSGASEPVEVRAYAGHRADVEPRAVRWRGRWRHVTTIISRARRQEGREVFVVILEGGSRLRLEVDDEGRWWR